MELGESKGMRKRESEKQIKSVGGRVQIRNENGVGLRNDR